MYMIYFYVIAVINCIDYLYIFLYVKYDISLGDSYCFYAFLEKFDLKYVS
jgi:hypothetical protein